MYKTRRRCTQLRLKCQGTLSCKITEIKLEGGKGQLERKRQFMALIQLFAQYISNTVKEKRLKGSAGASVAAAAAAAVYAEN